MNILITGGSGFIGNHLINFLQENIPGVQICNLDHVAPDKQNANVIFHKVDIRNLTELEPLDLSDYEVCIHLAALCKEPGFEWDEYFQTNHVGTNNVIEICEQNDIRSIIFTSTMMVHRAADEQMTEKSMTAPDTAYGGSKLLAEKELEIWKSKSDDRLLKIIRPAVVFGKNENANFTRLYASLKKGFFPYVGRNTTVKSNIYVKEVVMFIHYLLHHPTTNHLFNFAFPEKSDMKTIIASFCKTFGFNPFTPVLPFRILKLLSYGFEFINALGLKNSIHHRRIEKLYYSTNIYPKNAIDEGYQFNYTLESALKHWKTDGI